MRLEAKRVAEFIRDPGACRAVLLYGDDAGLIRSRADALVAAIAGEADDPFQVTELGRPTASDLIGAASALPLTGERPVVRVRDATDAATEAIRAILAGSSQAFIVLEGAGLPARSRLRAVLEADETGAAIGCYPLVGRDLARSAQELAAERGLTIDADAARWLSSGETDYGQLRQDIEKLCLFNGMHGAIDLAAAQECFSSGSSASLEDALFAATAGEVAGCDDAIAQALETGQAAVPALRAAISHIQRLLRARQSVDAGGSVEQAISKLRPPLFWRRQRAFAQAMMLWDTSDLVRLLTLLQGAEHQCKQTGMQPETVCAEALLTVAVQAGAKRGGSGVNRP